MLTADLVFIGLLCFCKKSTGVILHTNDFVFMTMMYFLVWGTVD